MSSPESETVVKYDTVIDPRVRDNSHSQMIAAIASGSKVLDVGCASGVLGEYLHREMACTVVGIDNDAGLLEIAATRNAYRSLHNLDLEQQGFAADIGDRFDYVLLGDIIEHLRDPKSLVESLIPLLAKDGCFLISIPNITHGSIKLGLLLNQFDYSEEGILDRTHLRFYTASSAYDFAGDCGLEVTNFSRVFAPIYQQENGENLGRLPRSLRRYVENDTESWVFQYILTASPGHSDSLQNTRKLKTIEPEPSEIARLRKLKSRWSRQILMKKLAISREKQTHG